MAYDLYSQFINVSQFSSGRRRFTYAQTMAVLKEQKHKALAAFAKQGIDIDEKVAATEQQYAWSSAGPA